MIIHSAAASTLHCTSERKMGPAAHSVQKGVKTQNKLTGAGVMCIIYTNSIPKKMNIKNPAAEHSERQDLKVEEEIATLQQYDAKGGLCRRQLNAHPQTSLEHHFF